MNSRKCAWIFDHFLLWYFLSKNGSESKDYSQLRNPSFPINQCMEISNILILGLGGVGLHLAKRLVQEGYNVTAIEADHHLIQQANESLDARCIEGNAMQIQFWREAQAEKMDLMIAVTNLDTLNMIASLIADRFSIPKKIVRLRSREFAEEESILTAQDLKIDLVIHPEELVAQEMAQIIQRTAGNDVIELADSEVTVIATRVYETSTFAHKKLKELSTIFPPFPFRLVSIARGIRTLIPFGEMELLPNDQVFLLVETRFANELMEFVGMNRINAQKLMILGGGLIGERVAELIGERVQVHLVEKSEQKAEYLADQLPDTEVLFGDGTDANVLVLAGLVEMDTFIATTGDNETNIISCLLAKHLMNKQNRDPHGGEGKTIALVDKEDYLVLASTIGLDIALNAKISAANEILNFIRRQKMVCVAHLHGVDAEILELVAGHRSVITKKPLYRLHVLQEHQILIGAVMQEGRWQVAVGDTHLQEGEKALVICLSNSLQEVKKIFQ